MHCLTKQTCCETDADRLHQKWCNKLAAVPTKRTLSTAGEHTGCCTACQKGGFKVCNLRVSLGDEWYLLPDFPCSFICLQDTNVSVDMISVRHSPIPAHQNSSVQDTAAAPSEAHVVAALLHQLDPESHPKSDSCPADSCGSRGASSPELYATHSLAVSGCEGSTNLWITSNMHDKRAICMTKKHAFLQLVLQLTYLTPSTVPVTPKGVLMMSFNYSTSLSFSSRKQGRT